MNGQLLLLFILFVFGLKAQTITPKASGSDSGDNYLIAINNLQVYFSNHRIYFSIPDEYDGKESLSLELYDANEKLISTNCMECCRSIDVSGFSAGKYFYVIRSVNKILKSGKLIFN